MSRCSGQRNDPSGHISRKDAISQLVQSIAMEEMSLAALVSAEAERLRDVPRDNVLEVNESICRTLRETMRMELILLLKLEETLQHTVEDGYRPCCDKG